MQRCIVWIQRQRLLSVPAKAMRVANFSRRVHEVPNTMQRDGKPA
jgi:hypothetical protein